MDVSLFAKCAPFVMLVGVTGTRGKSMTTALIYEILKQNSSFIKINDGQGKVIKNRNIYLGGNVRGVATLPLLKKVKDGDILVCELDSWQLQGFREASLSPHISVFTSFMPDHMNYYKNSMEKYFDDKASIFINQKKGDFLVTSKEVKKLIKDKIESRIILADKKEVAGFKFIVPGDHQKQNLSYAVKVAEILGIPMSKIKKSVASFKGVEGRLEFLRNYKGIKIYNDNNATTPEATIAGIEALKSNKKNIILICGGADKGLDLNNFVKTVNKNCKMVVMLKGSGTEKLITNYKLQITNEVVNDLKEAVKNSLGLASRGDTILFSPAFASFGMFNNEYERNDLFIKIIKGLPARNA